MLVRRAAVAAFVACLAWGASAIALSHTGTVSLRCAVVGAQVTVDGELVGTVPVDRFEVRVGVHTLRVVRAGLIAFQQQLRVHPGQRLTVVAVAKEERSLLTIRTTEKGGDVLVDGQRVGSLPLDSQPISPGQHSLFIRHEGLRPYQESFRVEPFREYVSTPTLRRRDGSVAAGPAVGLGLDLALDTPAPAKPAANGADLDLDLGLGPTPTPAPAKPAVAADDLDLDLAPVTPAPAPAKPAPAAVAANDLDLDLPLAVTPPAAPKPEPKPEVSTPPPALAFALPAEPAPPPRPTRPNLTARPRPSPRTPTFVAAAIPKPSPSVDEDDDEEEDTTPFFQKKWVWVTAAVIAVVGVAVPVAMGDTGGYREVRTPDSVCRDCLVVMNK